MKTGELQMCDGKFLHQHPEFEDIIQTVAKNQQIFGYLAEKDYWIMHCLFCLQLAGFEFKLKGGTSLSKGHGLIHRFSEDKDIIITPPIELALKTGKNHDKPNHIQGRKDYFDSLASEIVIDGIQTVRDTDFDDTPKYRHGGILLKYEPKFGTSESVIKEGVLLEVGLAKVVPNTPFDISSWAYDHAVSAGLDIVDNRARQILCYEAGYNLVEKLSAILTKYRLFKEGKVPSNFVRHYYDVYCLLKDEDVRKFTETEEFETYREECFRKPDYEIPLSKSPAFLLAEPAEFELIKKEYLSKSAMYYRRQPNFEEVMDTIRQWVADR